MYVSLLTPWKCEILLENVEGWSGSMRTGEGRAFNIKWLKNLKNLSESESKGGGK